MTLEAKYTDSLLDEMFKSQTLRLEERLDQNLAYLTRIELRAIETNGSIAKAQREIALLQLQAAASTSGVKWSLIIVGAFLIPIFGYLANQVITNTGNISRILSTLEIIQNLNTHASR